jgi:hypothetical protein
MFRTVLLAALASVVLAYSGRVSAQSQGGADEAKAMLNKAIAALKKDSATALAQFTSGEGGFRNSDLYVFCIDMRTGKFSASGGKPELIGTEAKNLKEKDGSPLGEKVMKAMKKDEISTVSYNFPRPGDNIAVPKTSYVTRVGDQGCGVGYYH